eukprot:403335681
MGGCQTRVEVRNSQVTAKSTISIRKNQQLVSQRVRFDGQEFIIAFLDDNFFYVISKLIYRFFTFGDFIKLSFCSRKLYKAMGSQRILDNIRIFKKRALKKLRDENSLSKSKYIDEEINNNNSEHYSYILQKKRARCFSEESSTQNKSQSKVDWDFMSPSSNNNGVKYDIILDDPEIISFPAKNPFQLDSNLSLQKSTKQNSKLILENKQIKNGDDKISKSKKLRKVFSKQGTHYQTKSFSNSSEKFLSPSKAIKKEITTLQQEQQTFKFKDQNLELNLSEEEVSELDISHQKSNKLRDLKQDQEEISEDENEEVESLNFDKENSQTKQQLLIENQFYQMLDSRERLHFEMLSSYRQTGGINGGKTPKFFTSIRDKNPFDCSILNTANSIIQDALVIEKQQSQMSKSRFDLIKMPSGYQTKLMQHSSSSVNPLINLKINKDDSIHLAQMPKVSFNQEQSFVNYKKTMVN